jgi:TonB family protein
MAAASETKSIMQKASADVMPADVISSPAPKYPAAASAAGVEGQVTVRAVVDPQGKVISTHVVSGPSLLSDAAEEAVQRWRYRPLLYHGKPITATTVAIVDFKVAR